MLTGRFGVSQRVAKHFGGFFLSNKRRACQSIERKISRRAVLNKNQGCNCWVKDAKTVPVISRDNFLCGEVKTLINTSKMEDQNAFISWLLNACSVWLSKSCNRRILLRIVQQRRVQSIWAIQENQWIFVLAAWKFYFLLNIQDQNLKNVPYSGG